MSSISTYKGQFKKDPPLVSWLLNSPRAAWIWLVLRVWLGYQWIDASLQAYGEQILGFSLILGAFTGLAAFFGAFMNWNFMMAGSASTNPMLLLIALGLILAWKISGYLGLDYFLLRWIGTPWKDTGIMQKSIE